MPNLIERFFRAMILYAGLWWLVAGLLWAIPASYMQWIVWDSRGHLRGNELYFAVMLLLIYGCCPITGLISVSYFRELARRQYRQIPGIAEMTEPQWRDTAVFTTLLSTGAGLYCLELVFISLGYVVGPFTLIGGIVKETAIGLPTNLTVLDVWYDYVSPLHMPIIYLGCAIVFLTQSGKIAARVTRMIDTTPPPPEDDDMPSEGPSAED